MMTKCANGRLGIFVVLLVAFGFAHPMLAAEDFYIPANPPSAQYKIDVKIEVSGQAIAVSGVGTITFKSNLSKPLSVVAVDWSIDGTNAIEISSGGKALRLLNPEKGLAQTTPLLYELPAPVRAGSTFEVSIRFSRRFGANSGGSLALPKCHPTLWWDGIPSRDSYRVKTAIPPGYKMAISGRLNRETGYYENDGVTTAFGIYLARNLKSAEREVEGVLIRSFFTPSGEECARLCLDTAVDIVRFYKTWLGFYPFKCLTIIPGGTRPMGGYPFASAMVVIHGQEQFKEMPPLHWKWITAHEIGHQYWGETVMSDDYPYNYTSSWLLIGMGICTDRKWTMARNLGQEKHLAFMNRYLEGVKKRYDTTVDAPESLRRRQNFDLNNVVIHGKEFSILSALESVIGPDTFEKVLKQSLREYTGRRLGWKDFAKICEAVSGQNLDWFFEQWVRSNKYLCYRITSRESAKQTDHYLTRLRVEGAPGCIQMPVLVKSIFEDGSSQIKTTERLVGENVLSFECRSKLKEAVLDPEHALAMLAEPLALLPEEIPEKIRELPWRGSGKEALRIFRLPEAQKIDDADLLLKLGMTLFDGAYYTDSLEAFTRITKLNPPKLLHFNALVWMGHDEDMLSEREKAIADYREALNYDTGDSMQHSQYGMTINRQWVEERLKTPFTGVNR
jgi:tetratricopeptide (TPR) repeat protein